MVLHNLQKRLNTPEKFYEAFISSPEGQAIFQSAHQIFPHFNEEENDSLNAQQYILQGTSNWVIQHLSDDEMITALIWLDSMNTSLLHIISTDLVH